MGYGTESSLFGIVAAVLGIVLILTVVLRMWKKVPQDKAGVVTGMKKRVITGGGGLVIPVFERIDYISLGNIPLSVATRSSLSSQGVPISVITTEVIKVRNEKNRIHSSVITAAASSEAVPPTIPQNYLTGFIKPRKQGHRNCPFGCLYSDRL